MKWKGEVIGKVSANGLLFLTPSITSQSKTEPEIPESGSHNIHKKFHCTTMFTNLAISRQAMNNEIAERRKVSQEVGSEYF